MQSRIKYVLLIGITAFSLLFTLPITLYAETATYTYDELNRLIRVEYGDGRVIEYTYDKAGNRLAIVDTTPPEGSISAPASSQSINVTLTLNCTDNVGCNQMQLSHNNVDWYDPEVYTSTKAWVLECGDGQKTVYVKYKDAAGNWSPTYQSNITLVTDGCTNRYVKVEDKTFCSLQDAYSDSATTNGKTIKSRTITFTENLAVNRNITVTLQGGYDCNFSAYTGNMTSIKGTITTTSGGGTITIGNIILSQ